MSTNRAFKQRILQLVKAGFSQKVIAGKIGVTQSWLSRWLKSREGKKAPVINADQMDGIREYLDELAALIQAIQHEAPTVVGETFSEANGTTGPTRVESVERKR